MLSELIPACLASWNLFFFQAEDGIRDLTVTGVQTCALPISRVHRLSCRHRTQRAAQGEQRIGEIGRASCRERVEISVVGVSSKKKTAHIEMKENRVPTCERRRDVLSRCIQRLV